MKSGPGVWPRLLSDRAIRTRRITFGAYAAVIFVLTHWPKLEVPIPVQRPDIIAHMGVFGLWTILCALCGWFGPWHRARNILITTPVAAAYSGIDEWLQAIPFIRRQAAWDDFAANVAGVICGAIFVAVLAAWWSKRLAGSSACSACGYSLVGTSPGVPCPECGAATPGQAAPLDAKPRA